MFISYFILYFPRTGLVRPILLLQLIEDEEEKKEGTIAKPELSPTSVKVPLNPAFRHTEYAKGFYKVQD